MIVINLKTQKTFSSYLPDNRRIADITISNTSNSDIKNIKAVIYSFPEFIVQNSYDIKLLPSKRKYNLKHLLTPSPIYFAANEIFKGFIRLDLFINGNPKAEYTSGQEVEIVPESIWATNLPIETLATFICPNTKDVKKIISTASYYLKSMTGDKNFFSSYLYGGSLRIRFQITALQRTFNEHYSFHKNNQSQSLRHINVISYKDILENRQCDNINIALLFSACLEAAGLNPIICIMSNLSVIIGCWLKYEKLNPENAVISDKHLIKRLFLSKDMIYWILSDSLFDTYPTTDFEPDNIDIYCDQILYILDVISIRVHCNIHPLTSIDTIIEERTTIDKNKGRFFNAKCGNIISKYKKARRETLKFNKNNAYIEILSGISSLFKDKQISKQTKNIMEQYPYHEGILSKNETQYLFSNANIVFPRLISHIFHTRPRFACFLSSITNFSNKDSVLVIHDESCSILHEIALHCGKYVSICKNPVCKAYQELFLNIINKQEFSTFTLFEENCIDNIHKQTIISFDKILCIIPNHCDSGYAEKLIKQCFVCDHLTELGTCLLIIPYRHMNILNNLADKDIMHISRIFAIPKSICGIENTCIVTITKGSNLNIEIINGLLIPTFNKFGYIYTDNTFREYISATTVYKNQAWCSVLQSKKNPFDPSAWTIPYDEYTTLNNVAMVQSADNNNSDIDACRCISSTNLQKYLAIHNKTEINPEKLCQAASYYTISSSHKYYKISYPCIIITGVGKEGMYQNRFIIHINYSSRENKPIFIDENCNILVIKPNTETDIEVLSNFIQKDYFFHKQLMIYNHYYTNRQIQNIFNAIIPKKLTFSQDKTLYDRNKDIVLKYLEHDTYSHEELTHKALCAAAELKYTDNTGTLIEKTNISDIADMLVEMEFVKPIEGEWNENFEIKKSIKYTRLISLKHKLSWKVFNNVFLKKDGTAITSQELSSRFNNSERKNKRELIYKAIAQRYHIYL